MLQFPVVERSEASGGNVQPKEWTPGKQDLIDSVRANIHYLDQIRTSTPTHQRKSQTEEKSL